MKSHLFYITLVLLIFTVSKSKKQENISPNFNSFISQLQAVSCPNCPSSSCDQFGYCKNFFCKEGNYGLKCDQQCACEQRSNNNKCSKFSGECIDCKFGYFGNNCTKKCHPKCKTSLCCIFKEYKSSDKKRANFLLKAENLTDITIKINDTSYKLMVDYSVGYPLTLFSLSGVAQCPQLSGLSSFIGSPPNISGVSYSFKDFTVSGDLYNNVNVTFNGNDKNVNLDVLFASSVKCDINKNYPAYNGVIGLGFFNSLSSKLSETKEIEQNIISYELDDNKIKILIGDLMEEEKEYVTKLSSCEVILDSNSDIQQKEMKCLLEGMKSSDKTNAIQLANATVAFSLNEQSTFTLQNVSTYIDYLKNYYFSENNLKIKTDTKNNLTYFCYKTNFINKLFNLDFVFNNYYYSYTPDKFFTKDEDSCDKDYSRFNFNFNRNIEKSEIKLGKEFLEKTKFTINNEEGIIYFYTRDTQYFDGKIEREINGEGLDNTYFGPQINALLCIAIVFILNSLSFGIYYFRKRKQNKKLYGNI